MKAILIFLAVCFLLAAPANSQFCFPLGDQVTYGTNNVWRGYVYDNPNYTAYRGYVTEGNAGSPDFDQGFGGDNVSYTTNGCPVTTTTFSVRYKLRKAFADNYYDFTVGGDDGFRLSLDGGATWIINRWIDQGYTASSVTVHLNGTYNMILEFYENNGSNRILFNVAASCGGSDDTNIYGSGNTWNGYVYDGTNFDIYKGMIHAGAGGNPAFDQNFGGNTTFSTSGCTAVESETFSVRYRLTKNFPAGLYTFFVGGDDGYRLSIDGGSTWIINRWNDQAYATTSYPVTLAAGSYNLVLEYYENGGENRLSFNIQGGVALPVHLISFTGNVQNNKAVLSWKTAAGSNPDHFDIERSNDGGSFQAAGTVSVPVNAGEGADMSFSYTDMQPLTGKVYYRLKMTDRNGVVTYSGIIFLSGDRMQEDQLIIYPTVLKGNQLSLRSGRKMDNAVIAIINSAGAVISKNLIGKITAGQTVSFTAGTASLPKGMHIVIVSDGDVQVAAKKIIVM